MPRYFFDTKDGDNDRDEEGVELADADAARVQGVHYLGSLIVDNPLLVRPDHPFEIHVRNDRRGTVARVSVSIAEEEPPAGD